MTVSLTDLQRQGLSFTPSSLFTFLGQMDAGRIHNAGVAGGSANAITLTNDPAFSALADGMQVSFRAANDNSGATTVNIDGLGTVDVVDVAGNALVGGEIITDGRYLLTYDSNSGDCHLSNYASAWQSWTPTLDAKLSSATISVANYLTLPNLCLFILTLNATKNSTTTNLLTMTLPFTAADNNYRACAVGHGGAGGSTMLYGYTQAANTILIVKKYDASSFTNSTSLYFRLFGAYQTA